MVHARKMNILEITEEGKPFKVGFLAYNDADVVPESYHAATDHAGSNIMEIQKLKEDISQNREMVDLLVISMHSGTEYAKTANSRQTEFARAAIDNGADMVIGHHPHVLQPIEVYKGKYIFYSLGNFIFDQPWPDTKQSVLARMKIAAVYDDQKWHIKSFQPEIKPLAIQNFQPEMIMDNNSSQFKAVLARFRFPYSLLTLGDQTVLVGMATTTETRTKGLSGTRELTKGQGLLFRFDEVKRHGIWMKDMNYPIDIYWFDDNFTLVHKEISVPPESFPNVFYPLKPARYVLETRVGELEGVSLTADLTGILTEVYYYDKK